MQFRAILTLTALALTLSTGLCAPATPAPPDDDVILEMNQAFKRADRKRLAALLPQARGHVLEPWASYWELKARLEDATPQEVQDTLTRYAGSYQEDRLRNDWLLLLGSRRDWTNFAAEHPKYRMGDDREVRCYALAIDLIKAGPAAPAALAEEARRLWYAQRDADDGCTLAADRLFDAKKLSALDIWRKARLAAEANRPRALRDAVQIASPESGALVGELLANPAKFLASKVFAASRTRKELVVLALIRMAASDVDSAAAQLEQKWAVMLTPEERHWTWAVMGKQAALRLSPSAAEYFAKVEKDSDLNDDLLTWKTRTALRQGDWRGVLASIHAMGPETQQDPTWVYWKARARQALAKTEAERAEAQRLFEGIASVRGFYEQLALDALGQRVSPPPRPQPPSPEEKEAALRNPSLARALAAIQLGLRSEGVREWNYATNLHTPGGMSDRELLAAAQLACDRAVWDRCINTSERTRGFMDFEQRFPTPFREAVVKRSKEIALDPAYVYGLIRQESRFIVDVRSGVGASGLMQVMPATARWTAKKLGLAGFTPEQITDRDTNITIGTGYLKLILDDFAGSLPLAAAAYNAGPNRPRAWRNGPVLDAAIWAESVPFHETRDYVKKVLANTTSYAALLTGQPQSLRSRLGLVGPRDASAPEENRELP